MKKTSANPSPRQRVVQSLQMRIAAGELLPGQKLPAECELAEELAVSRGTVRAALQQLVENGVVEARHGYGCYVGKAGRESTNSARRAICFLVPLAAGRTLYDEILAGIESAASLAGYSTSFINLTGYGAKPEEIFEKLQKNPPSGVIFSPLTVENYYETNSRFIDYFEHQLLPHVVVDSPVARDGIIRGNFVGSDGYSAMRQVVRHLVELGHRRIGSIRVFPGVYTSDSRANGIFDQLRQENLPFLPEYHQSIQNSRLEDQGRPRLRQLMSLPEPPTAIICSHDTLAMNVMDEARKMGIRVPETLSIFGFDDDYFAEFIKLATVCQPFREIGVRAARMVIEMQEHPNILRQEFLPCELVPRDSIAPACATFAQGE